MTIIGLYGSSELQALFSHFEPHDPTERRARAGGVAASGIAKVRARDPQSKSICLPGEAGELEFLAPESRFVAYYNDPESTRSAFTDDGYFRSGDLGFVEADASFTFLGRMGDTLRLGGFLVSPAEIEEWVQAHPTVAACQVVGIPVDGAVKPIAFVMAQPGAEVDEADVIRHVAGRLAMYKVPVRVFVVPEFPTTPSANGFKVQKNRLREMAQDRLAGVAVVSRG